MRFRNLLSVGAVLALLGPALVTMAANDPQIDPDLEGPAIPESGFCKPGAGCAPVYVDETGDTMTGDLVMQADIRMAPGNHIRSTDSGTPLSFLAGNNRLLRIEYASNNTDSAPNIIGGFAGNAIGSQAVGGTISGGGDSGKTNRVLASYGTLSGGNDNTASGQSATVGGGAGNTASGNYATVGGGNQNTASGTWTTVGGGSENIASFKAGTVAGGRLNEATGSFTSIGGGLDNLASGGIATVGGGDDNIASGERSTVGGGSDNLASGKFATVAGGSKNTAAGFGSFAAGYLADAAHNSAIVLSSKTGGGQVSSPASSTLTVYAQNGIWLGKSGTPSIPSGRFIQTSTGAYLSTGGTWVSTSDRDAKENFGPVDARDILERVNELPLSTWNYKAESDDVRHLGPMAQDFRAKFGLGDGDQHIAGLDANGVALAAIQGLSLELEERDQRIQELEASLAAQEAQLDAILAWMETQ